MNPIPLTPMVKRLLIITIGIWVFGQIILERMVGLRIDDMTITSLFALQPAKVLFSFQLWQPFTYMFLHAFEPNHILFNMLMLWFMGSELENYWGSRFFLIYYLVCGVGAGILYCLAVWIYYLLSGNLGPMLTPVIGASGALYGLILSYGLIFGERTIYFMMVFPMKAKHFAVLLGVIQLISLMSFGLQGTEVAYLAHLGGIVVGFLYLKGRDWWNRHKWSTSRGRKLRLVVDNEKKPEIRKDPKYWN